MEADGGGYYNQDGNTWVDASLGRWKSNVTPITGALDTVLRLNGVSFKWKKRTDVFETTPGGEQQQKAIESLRAELDQLKAK